MARLTSANEAGQLTVTDLAVAADRELAQLTVAARWLLEGAELPEEFVKAATRANSARYALSRAARRAQHRQERHTARAALRRLAATTDALRVVRRGGAAA
ncbi:hypothetical protein [Longimycelium tulufanense]|nr:hypothetical protein [Longimycelium tulufanense]